jgi:hypothetical protein
MYRSVSNRVRAGLAFFVLALAPRAALLAAPQQDASNVVSSEIAISRERAEIKLELDDGRKVTLATVTGAPRAVHRSGTASDATLTLGVERGDAIDRAWRDLLNRAMEASSADLATVLRDWRPPNAGGSELDQALESALSGTGVPSAPVPPAAPVAPGLDDSVSRLENKIEQLQEQLQNARGDAIAATRKHRGPDWLAPVRHVVRGISGIFATLVTYCVLFGIGFAVVMFGGRKYIEGVADTVRAGITRSFLVGLAGSFLLVPVFVLGVIALAISIVGIPALLVWIPLYPLGTVAAVVLGFLGVAHAAGESWAERRYYGSEWFSRANSYFFMVTGLALLASLFIAAHIITMAGPWLGFINNILNFFGIMVTWAAATIGFGAVLISRGGKRGVDGSVDAAPYSEANV